MHIESNTSSNTVALKFTAPNAVFLLSFLCQKSVQELPFAWKYGTKTEEMDSLCLEIITEGG